MGIEIYDRAIERFTWREQLNGNGEKILSNLYKQTTGTLILTIVLYKRRFIYFCVCLIKFMHR